MYILCGYSKTNWLNFHRKICKMIGSQNYESSVWKILIFKQTGMICKAACIDYLSWRAGAVCPNPTVSTSRTYKPYVCSFAVHNGGFQNM